MKHISHFILFIVISNILMAGNFASAKNSSAVNLHELASEGNLKSFEKNFTKNTDVDKKDESGSTLLMAAANNGHVNIINFLIKRKANLNLRNKEDGTALYYAIINEQPAASKLLIDNGADVTLINEAGDSALIAAVSVNATDTIKQLLRKHPELLNKANKDKNTPLHEAIRNGSKETFEIILKAGADKTLKDDLGRNALDLAKAEKNKYAEKLLSK
ncbi:MAG TPA: ankyrin repeat domain-containing protein [Bdellovibrio sp.]